jgi:hypothetical protein
MCDCPKAIGSNAAGRIEAFLPNDWNRAQEDLSTFHVGMRMEEGEYLCREIAPSLRGI